LSILCCVPPGVNELKSGEKNYLGFMAVTKST